MRAARSPTCSAPSARPAWRKCWSPTSRATALETVRRVADALFIPLTVGGGVRSIEDFRALLRAGADRVAINTAAIRDPQLIADCAREFGVQAVVLSCDAKGREVMVRSG